MRAPTADDLAGVPLLAGLDETTRAAVAAALEVEEHSPGHVVVSEGRAGYAFYLVADGKLAVTVDGREVRDLGPGDFFGEIAIIGDGGRRTATVTAVTPVIVWVLFGTRFRALQIEAPDVAAALESEMRHRLESG
jgi:CRP-like cAMP-binding protein